MKILIEVEPGGEFYQDLAAFSETMLTRKNLKDFAEAQLRSAIESEVRSYVEMSAGDRIWEAFQEWLHEKACDISREIVMRLRIDA